MRGRRRRDAGSEQIRTLLEAESERLAQDRASLIVGLQALPGQEFGVPPQTVFDAIADCQAAYDELILQINAVETTNPAKSDVVEALTGAYEGLGQYQSGLEDGVSRRGLKRLKRASRALKRAGQDLQGAAARL
jgi:hypothetical protein